MYIMVKVVDKHDWVIPTVLVQKVVFWFVQDQMILNMLHVLIQRMLEWFVQVDSKYSCSYDIIVGFHLIHVHKVKVMFISLIDWYQTKDSWSVW